MDNKILIDQSAAVRPGEELDNPELQAFLQTALAAQDMPAKDAEFTVEQFRNGYSNLTYRVRWGELDLVLRRPPFGANIKSGHDMEREFRVLSGLFPVYPKVPRPVVYCDDVAVLGAPFYLMERVEGVILRRRSDANDAITPPVMEAVSKSFIENLAAIHGLDWAATDLKQLARPGSYVERQVTGWVQRYAKAKTDDLMAMERVGSWLSEHRPADTAASLIHNDYKYDNMVLDGANLAHIRAVLDWEMATVGDPLMDLGTTLAYWVDPDDATDIHEAYGDLTLKPGNFDRIRLIQHYAQQSGREVGNIVFYYVFGLFKNAVIAQQIYARYKQGLTADERFERLIQGVRAFASTAVQAIEKNRLDRLG